MVTRLGPDFSKFWLASGISGVGDGMYVTALPLLAAALTRDPIVVSAVFVAEWVPFLLFGLVAGALLDRWDRGFTIWVVDAARLVIVGGVGVAVLLHVASIPLLIVGGFLLGTGKTFVDIAAQAVVPMIVSRDPAQLNRANVRLQATNLLSVQFAGPPLGGLLFGLSMGLPFIVDAVSFGAGAALVATIRARMVPSTDVPSPPADAADPPATGLVPTGRRLRDEVREGLGWLAHHPLLRTMTVLVGAVNLAGAMMLSILVLYIEEKLGLGGIGFGILLMCYAAGGALGSVIGARVIATIGPGRASLLGLYLLAVAPIGFAITSTPWVAGLLMAINGVATVVFNVVFNSLRQELVPERLLGRVGGTVLLICFSAIPVGGLVGGALGAGVGLRAPFAVAGALIALLALAATPIVSNRSIAQARAALESTTA
jgi:MFS family permease